MKSNLKDKLSKNFISIVIKPLILIGILLIILITIFRNYIFHQIHNVEIRKSKDILELIIHNRKNIINDGFNNFTIITKLKKQEDKTDMNISITNIIDKMLKKRLPFEADMFIVDKNGTIINISQKLKELINRRELNNNLYNRDYNIFNNHNNLLFQKIRNMIKNNINESNLSLDEDKLLIFQQELISINSTLILCVKESKILGSITKIKNDSLKFDILILFIFLVFLLIIYIFVMRDYNKFSQDVANPIISLSKISANINKYKNNNIVICSTDIDEINELNHNFIKMITKLNEKTQELKEFNKNLKIKVKEATKELREKNKNINHLLDSTMEAIIIWDDKYNIKHLNKSCSKIFEYDNLDILIGQNIYKVIPESEIKTLKKTLKQDNTDAYEINLYKNGNILFPALVKGTNTIIDNKIHRISTIIDLTNIKNQERLLLEQTRRAQMGEMLSMIAHQWRQPLSAISATAGSIIIGTQLKNINDEKILKLSSNIEDYTQHLSTTINDFRDFFKPNKAQENITYKELIDSVLNIMEVSIINKNIKLVKNLNDNKIFYTYSNELKQVIINLLKNAEDSLIESKTENPTITIYTHNNILEIADNGGGINNDIIDKIFEPYFSTKNKNGTGLGLYMSKTIIEKHCKGKLSVTNHNGAVFKIKLPT